MIDAASSVERSYRQFACVADSSLEMLRAAVPDVHGELSDMVARAERHYRNCKMPVWCKVPRLEYKLVFASKIYRETYAAQYVGKGDEVQWGKDAADFRRNDHRVATTGVADFFVESGVNQATGRLECWTVHKWPETFRYNGLDMVAVWGMVISTHVQTNR